MNREKLVINLDANTKGFDYQIEEAQAKLDDLLATYKILCCFFFSKQFYS